MDDIGNSYNSELRPALKLGQQNSGTFRSMIVKTDQKNHTDEIVNEYNDF